jgi:hypothetical protein
MVAAIIGIGGVIGSNSAANATQAQKEMLQQQLAYQQHLLSLYDPQIRDAQSFAQQSVEGTRGQGFNYLTGYGGQAIEALRGGTKNAIDTLQGFFPSEINRLEGGNTAAQNYLQFAAQQARGNANPYMTAGGGAAGILGSELASGALGGMPSLTDFSQLPGYQFTRDQGLAAARNAASATGYGGIGAEGSGPLGKALINYSEGLANTFGSQYLSNYWQNQQGRAGILGNVAGMGAQAAGNLDQILANIAGNQSSAELGTGANVSSLISGLANNVGNIWNNFGTGQSNILGNLGGNIANLLANNTAAQVGATLDPMKILIGLATNTGSNFNSAISNASQGIANSIQNQGNILGAGFSGASQGLQNYALYNKLLGDGGGSGGGGYGAATGTGGL